MFALFKFLKILKFSLMIIKAQGIQISLTKDRLSKTAYQIYSTALIKKNGYEFNS